jgi:hypothetical protein
MLRTFFHGIVAVALAASLAVAQKKTLKSETQPRGALVETQGTPGQDPRDEILMYRFRLSASDADLRLVVTNSTEAESAFTLAGESHVVAPGETVALEPWDTEWLRAEGVVVKAPRRLQLSLHSEETGERIALKHNPKTSVYEIFSAERVPSSARGRRELLSTQRKGNLVLYQSK